MSKHRSTESTHAGRVALVGRPNVGKSTLLNTMLGEPIAITSAQPQTTRETVRGVLTDGDAQYVLLDTPGLHAPRNRLGQRMNAAARGAARDADVVVLVVAAPREGAEARANAADIAIAEELAGAACVLAINKTDRLRDKSALLPFIASFADHHAFAAVVPVSAKRGTGLARLLEEVRSLLPEQPFLFEPDTLSDQPERFFVAEFVREQILRHTKQEVPHGVAVVVDRFDEGGKASRIEVSVHVARESHKKILIGARGRMLKSIGIAARARIERMLSRPIHLQLRVRATPGWMDDQARLRELVGT
jgi:GTP-binding protein Era